MLLYVIIYIIIYIFILIFICPSPQYFKAELSFTHIWCQIVYVFSLIQFKQTMKPNNLIKQIASQPKSNKTKSMGLIQFDFHSYLF